MAPPIASNDLPALYPAHEKPALVALTDSPSSDHGSRENKLENGAFYDSAASDISPTLSGADEKKLLRRIDWRLLPLLAAMYVIKTIDAQNVSDRVYLRINQPDKKTHLTRLRFLMRVQWTKAQSIIS
jgi:hypothetical protein